MGGTGLPHRLETDFDTGELLPLPDAYKIESVGNLRTGGLETSMPDVSKGVEGMLLSKCGPGSSRLGIGGLLTRDEVCRLGQQRRHELLLDRERKKRGEIIIRLADIKVIRSSRLIATSLCSLLLVGKAFSGPHCKLTSKSQ